MSFQKRLPCRSARVSDYPKEERTMEKKTWISAIIAGRLDTISTELKEVEDMFTFSGP
jgi:hypothetical protein